MVSTYVGENKVFEKMALAGEIEVELNPQGTFAERMRAGGAGIPAFFTPAGYGTLVAEGKEVRWFTGGPTCSRPRSSADYAFVKAWKGDPLGNLVYRRTTRNFAPMMAMAATVHHRGGGGARPRGRARPRRACTPGHLRAADLPGQRLREAHREADAARRRRAARPTQARAHRAARGARDEGRRLREPRHRHADARVELHPPGDLHRPALRERHARRGALPGARARRTPTSSTPARRR